MLHIPITIILIASLGLNTYYLIKNTSETNKSQTEENTSTSCTGTEIINADNLETVDINCGDKITLTVEYKGSTGYEPFSPQYNDTVFTLESEDDVDTSNELLGGDSMIRTYTFKSISRAVDSGIEVGIHRSWEPNTTREVQQSVTVNVQ